MRITRVKVRVMGFRKMINSFMMVSRLETPLDPSIYMYIALYDPNPNPNPNPNPSIYMYIALYEPPRSG